MSFARFQNDTGNVEIAIDAPTTAETIEAQCQEGTETQSPYTEAPEIPPTTPPKTPTAWKKLTRAFVNPLFGEPSAASVCIQLRALYDYVINNNL